MIKLLATAAFGFGLEPVSIKEEATPMNNSCCEPAQKPAAPIRAAAGLAQKLLAARSILGALAACIRPLPNRPIMLGLVLFISLGLAGCGGGC